MCTKKSFPAPKEGGCPGECLYRSGRGLEEVLELVAGVLVLAVVGDARVAGDERVLRADIQIVVHLPVDVAHLPCRVEQALPEREERCREAGGRKGEGDREKGGGLTWRV